MSIENRKNDSYDDDDNYGDDNGTGNNNGDDELYNDIDNIKFPYNNNNEMVNNDVNNITTITAVSTITNSDTATTTTNDVSNNLQSYDFLSSSHTTSTIQQLPKNSLEQIPILHEQIQQLRHENTILKRNIGILYRTAITEIQRKDQQIQQFINSNKKP
jgi:hypothetical protein